MGESYSLLTVYYSLFVNKITGSVVLVAAAAGRCLTFEWKNYNYNRNNYYDCVNIYYDNNNNAYYYYLCIAL